MKYFISIMTLTLISTLMWGQNNQGYQEFVNSRSEEHSQFIKEREAQYKEFKAQYYEAFAKYKQLYEGYINEEISLIDLMASDDNLPITPISKEVDKPILVSSAATQKELLRENLKTLSALTPEEVLGELSEPQADSLEQMAQAAMVMQQLVVILENDTDQAPLDESLFPQASKVVLEAYDPEDYKRRKAEIESAQQVESQVSAQEEATQEQAQQEGEESAHTSVEKASEEPIFKYENGKVSLNTPSGSPTAYTRISSPFGTRIHPITRRKQTHKGIDMAAPRMTPVYATADGKVTFAKYNGGYGNFVKINHQNGYKTAYAHLHKIAVNNGDNIKKGDLVGYVGTTGRSTGNHLHYEVYYNESLVDPATTL